MIDNDRLMGSILAAQPEIQLDFDLIAELYGPGVTARTIQSKMNKPRRIGETLLAVHNSKVETGEVPDRNKSAWIRENAQNEARVVDSLAKLGNVKNYLGREKNLMESLPADLPVFRSKKRKTERAARISEFLANTDNPDLQQIDVVDLSSDPEDLAKNKHTMKADHMLNDRVVRPPWTMSDWPAQSGWQGKRELGAHSNQAVPSNWAAPSQQDTQDAYSVTWNAPPGREVKDNWNGQRSWHGGSNQDIQSGSGTLPDWGTENYQNAGNKRHARRLSRWDDPGGVPQVQQPTGHDYGWTDTSTINQSRNPISFMGSRLPTIWHQPGRQFARSVSQQNEENERNDW
ncbi:hypothetical protein PENARI_c041G08828 [Penicillium arizonense]|uniref:Uncharacterized protein n=1 Tax=Penicillium arizonense TaxID=1835702 RepID=A0A1F5L2X4_PENAI|nr:hypothetical protein PENARI_c041G08828 [Penicillium arizonense]OGE47578.1 hypothetical protein PENARI_c041G08828 [Penicillium arizonense]